MTYKEYLIRINEVRKEKPIFIHEALNIPLNVLLENYSNKLGITTELFVEYLKRKAKENQEMNK